ncbi:MAG TPA: hypothetical protein DCL80_14105 [Balneola sp.]|nr:hypothetical protein [Balneola sp.]MAO78958.1 hypothetical protein [Balneola sp.]MBF63617.1 hypothetical protein [Balneola sp.]HAH52314.1 hypothetical protein [Balneola sp.]HAW79621.1 hypothetical protein [Balneola sp.]
MKILTFVGLLLFLHNCTSSYSVAHQEKTPKTIALNASEVRLGDASKWFSDEVKNDILSINLTEEIGKNILQQIVLGYKNQIGNFEVSEKTESDIAFEVREVTVKRGRFTFNFLKPGPIYVMKMKADIIVDGKLVSSNTKKTVVNMASVNFPGDAVKFMKPSEKRNTEYQLATFRTGVRKLYQSLYFDALDISLRL